VAAENDSFYESFGELVRKHRERLGLTQEGLGRSVGLSRTSITNIEKGRQHVALHQVFALAGALEIPATTLLPRDEGATAVSALSKKLPGVDQDVVAWVSQVIQPTKQGS
jgi:transcriptional regulator with XRE-family HTH domain